MYAVNAEEVDQDATIITGTLLIHFILTVVLFNCSSTHTFIAKTFVNRFGLYKEDLCYDMVMLTPTGALHTTDECMQGVVAVI